MKINWWPWGVLTLVSLALLSFFVLYPLAVLFSNSVVDDGGGYSLAAFFIVESSLEQTRGLARIHCSVAEIQLGHYRSLKIGCAN